MALVSKDVDAYQEMLDQLVKGNIEVLAKEMRKKMEERDGKQEPVSFMQPYVSGTLGESVNKRCKEIGDYMAAQLHEAEGWDFSYKIDDDVQRWYADSQVEDALEIKEYVKKPDKWMR